MLAQFEHFIDWLFARTSDDIPEPPEPVRQTRWVVDLPPRDAVRLGSFRTKQEALDYRREYIIRTIKDTAEPIELPF